MEATTYSTHDIFSSANRYIIPLFQRHYVWKEEAQWLPLWEDIERKAKIRASDNAQQKPSPHFTGAIVIQQKDGNIKDVKAYEIIDGQQRLTTFQLILCAIRDIARNNGEQFKQVYEKAESLMFNTGLNLHEDDKFKLTPTRYDLAVFQAIMNSSISQDDTHNLVLAYQYFKDKIKKAAQDDVVILNNFLQAITQDFDLVQIRIDSGDDPETIFESLNGRGEPLRQFDLLRNHLFLRARHHNENKDELYAEHWAHFESREWEQQIGTGRHQKPLSELFLQHFLSHKLASEKVEPLFRTYKKAYLSGKFNATVTEELKDLARHSEIYKKLAININGNLSDIQQAMELYHVLGITTLRPLFLYLLIEEGLNNDNREKERKHVFDALESYVMRRHFCYPAQNRAYSFLFVSLIEKLRNEKFTVSRLIKLLEEEKTYLLIWPSDNDIKDTILNSAKQNKAHYILSRMESLMREKNSYTEDDGLDSLRNRLTVEHILPQGWKSRWTLPSSNGPILLKDIISEDYDIPYYLYDIPESERERILVDPTYAKSLNVAIERDKLIENIGNLTLLTRPLNSAQSNKPFSEKREPMEEHSSLLMNKEICRENDAWDVENIMTRGLQLHKLFCEIWPSADWFLKNIPK